MWSRAGPASRRAGAGARADEGFRSELDGARFTAVGKTADFNAIAIEIQNTQRLLAYSAALGTTAGAALFFDDVNRLEPFAQVPSILPDESVAAAPASVHAHAVQGRSTGNLERVLERLARAGLTPESDGRGSNAFAVAGAHSASGNAMVASDPHIQLGSPAVFHEIGIRVTPGEGGESLDVYGVGFPGIPYVVHGLNDHIAWGSTDNPTDVTDVYQEQLVTQGGVPAAIVHQGQQEPLEVIPETYRANSPANGTADDVTVVPPSPAIPPATFVVPRRNHFFVVPGLPTAAARRDFILLKSMRDALALAAGPGFAPAFGGSTDQSGYRWGKLHRVVFVHPVGGPFSIPPGARFAGLAPLLPGIPTDGGFTTVDALGHGPRAASVNAFMFGLGPARRFVAEPRRSHPRAVQVIPGGESGTPGQRFFGNQLELWLANDYHDVTLQRGEVERDAVSVEWLMPEESSGSNPEEGSRGG